MWTMEGQQEATQGTAIAEYSATKNGRTQQGTRPQIGVNSIATRARLKAIVEFVMLNLWCERSKQRPGEGNNLVARTAHQDARSSYRWQGPHTESARIRLRSESVGGTGGQVVCFNRGRVAHPVALTS